MSRLFSEKSRYYQPAASGYHQGHRKKKYLGDFILGIPLILGVSLCVLGYYNRNEFISGFKPGKPHKYAHGSYTF